MSGSEIDAGIFCLWLLAILQIEHSFAKLHDYWQHTCIILLLLLVCCQYFKITPFGWMTTSMKEATNCFSAHATCWKIPSKTQYFLGVAPIGCKLAKFGMCGPRSRTYSSKLKRWSSNYKNSKKKQSEKHSSRSWLILCFDTRRGGCGILWSAWRCSAVRSRKVTSCAKKVAAEGVSGTVRVLVGTASVSSKSQRFDDLVKRQRTWLNRRSVKVRQGWWELHRSSMLESVGLEKSLLWTFPWWFEIVKSRKCTWTPNVKKKRILGWASIFFVFRLFS